MIWAEWIIRMEGREEELEEEEEKEERESQNRD
jgi:hypothetical protein